MPFAIEMRLKKTKSEEETASCLVPEAGCPVSYPNSGFVKGDVILYARELASLELKSKCLF